MVGVWVLSEKKRAVPLSMKAKYLDIYTSYPYTRTDGKDLICRQIPNGNKKIKCEMLRLDRIVGFNHLES
jgi:hypothetical protein